MLVKRSFLLNSVVSKWAIVCRRFESLLVGNSSMSPSSEIFFWKPSFLQNFFLFFSIHINAPVSVETWDKHKKELVIENNFIIFLKFTKNETTAQKMKISIKDFFSKCDQMRRKLRIWSHVLKKSLIENLLFCVVNIFLKISLDRIWVLK